MIKDISGWTDLVKRQDTPRDDGPKARPKKAGICYRKPLQTSQYHPSLGCCNHCNHFPHLGHGTP